MDPEQTQRYFASVAFPRGLAVSNRSYKLLWQDEQLLTGQGQSAGFNFTLHALTAALHTAFEAAVFPDWFEIDEQGPASRIDALIEALVLQIPGPERKSLSDEECIAVTTIIQRIGASMRTLSNESKKSTKRYFEDNSLEN